MKDSNFKFLQKEFPILAKLGQLAEIYCYSDSNSCLMKLGMIGETVVKLIFNYDRIDLPNENTADKRIDILLRDDFITPDLAEILHALRQVRNKAIHENYSSVDTAKTFLQMTYSLCEWFMQTYGDWQYKNKPFVMPTAENQSISVDKNSEEVEEKKLIEIAETTAEQSEKLSKEIRKEQSHKAANQRIKSEAETRYLIDEQLRKVGWEADTNNLRYSKGTRPVKGHNMAIAEWKTDSAVGDSGFVDYALFIGTKMVATIEAKATYKDIPSVIDNQCKDYSKHIRDEDSQYLINNWNDYKVPFTFATNGRPYLQQYETKSGVWFLDLRKPDNAPKALRGWISPTGITELLNKNINEGNEKLQSTSYDLLRDEDGLNLRDYQIKAIQAAENAIINGQQNVLLAMATGTGKTRTVLGMIYRFLKSGRFRRILFLVDRNALGEQAQDVFKEVKLEELMTLDKIYNIKNLDDKTIDKETRIHVATVQSMVKRIIYNDDETIPAVTDYDLVIIDEAHRGYILDKEMSETDSLYRDQRDYQSKYRSVIDYFDAVKIALTATPALHTTEIFGKPVFMYSYREAVIDGYLVDHDVPHRLKTKLSVEGIHYNPGDTVAIYDPVTGEITNKELLDDELDFEIDNFNKEVINENFNREVLKEISNDIDAENPSIQGKTLIYAVDDKHADLIVKILKEIYTAKGVDNDAIRRIQEAIRRFKNERYPSVVVTVDLLTTGIDVPEITTLVFMRRIKSRILFEQMLGRATRLCPKINKTHFEIYDPVGVYESLQNVSDMKPVAANVSVTLEQLLDGLKAIDDDKNIKNQINQIIAKIRRLNLNDELNQQRKRILSDIKNSNPQNAKNHLIKSIDLLKILQQESMRKQKPIVISPHEDELISHKRGYGDTTKPEDYIESFVDYIKNNVNEVAALNIVCTRPKELTRQDLKNLLLTLDSKGFTAQKLNTAISQMTNETMTADIISLIRRYAIGSPLVSHEEKIKNAVNRLKKSHKFSKMELNWLDSIEKYLLNEPIINIETFNEDSRFKSNGGFNRLNKVFNNELANIIEELNKFIYDDGGNVA